jgi:hypothetical protein
MSQTQFFDWQDDDGSIYSRSEGGYASPDHPESPSSFDHYIASQGGRSSATDMSPWSLQRAKHEHLTGDEERWRAVFDASFLRAENSMFRKIRKCAIALLEGTVVPTIDRVATGAGDMHGALNQIHEAISKLRDNLQYCDRDTESRLQLTLDGLTPAFDLCRQGMAHIRAAHGMLREGGNRFAKGVGRANRSYAKFFGIDLEDLSTVS